MWNTVDYLTFHENAVRLHSLHVSILLMYLASKQVVPYQLQHHLRGKTSWLPLVPAKCEVIEQYNNAINR